MRTVETSTGKDGDIMGPQHETRPLFASPQVANSIYLWPPVKVFQGNDKEAVHYDRHDYFTKPPTIDYGTTI